MLDCLLQWFDFMDWNAMVPCSSLESISSFSVTLNTHSVSVMS